MIMSKYFSTEEMVCHCCGTLPDGGINPILLDKLDALREAIGKPIHVDCMYRCPSHNAEVGGVPNSQHVLGNAADIWVDDMGVDDLANLAADVGFDGIGRYYGSEFVHVDVRDDGNSPNYYQWNG